MSQNFKGKLCLGFKRFQTKSGSGHSPTHLSFSNYKIKEFVIQLVRMQQWIVWFGVRVPLGDTTACHYTFLVAQPFGLTYPFLFNPFLNIDK